MVADKISTLTNAMSIENAFLTAAAQADAESTDDEASWDGEEEDVPDGGSDDPKSDDSDSRDGDDDNGDPGQHSSPSPPPPNPAKLSKHEKCYRFEAVRNRTGTFLMSRDTIIEHLEQAEWNVDTTVAGLNRAHHRAFTYTRGHGTELELPTHVRGIAIIYYLDGAQERRQAVDILLLLVQQMNQHRGPTAQISLARTEAVLIMDAAGFDFETALSLLQDTERYTQMLHIRFDGLRTRTGSVKKMQEQSDAALAYYLTLTGRADWCSMKEHLDTTHQGDIVAAVADWHARDVGPVVHPDDVAGTTKEGVGRRKTWTNARLVHRPMPTLSETHEYTAQNLPWKAEPAVFATTTTAIGRQMKTQLMREAEADRLHGRPYEFVINHDCDYGTVHCPDEGKFLVEYVTAGRYRARGFGEQKQKQSAIYYWPTRDHGNPRHLPIFSWAKQKHVTRMNALRRQSYFRITGIIERPSGVAYTNEDLVNMWYLFQGYFEELWANRAVGTNQIDLPFEIPTTKKIEFAQAMTYDPSNPRSASGMTAQAHRNREICKDLLLKYDASNDHRAQSTKYKQRRKEQIKTIHAAVKKEKADLPVYFLSEALEQVAVPFEPWTWNEYSPVDATPPQRLPSTGLPKVICLKVEWEVVKATNYALAAGTFDDVNVWQQATEAIRHFYRSDMGASELVEIQVLLDLTDMSGLDLATIGEEEAIAIFFGLELEATPEG